MSTGSSLLRQTLSSCRSNHPELQLMLEDLEHVSPLFQPTHFWTLCLKDIVDDLNKRGMETFKSHPSALKYYVKTHADLFYLAQKNAVDRICQQLGNIQGHLSPGNSIDLHLDRVYKDAVDGQTRMEADYRVFRASDLENKAPILEHVSEDPFGSSLDSFQIGDKVFGASMLEYLRILTFLKKYGESEKLESFMEIGGGFGVLGEILLKAKPKRYFYFNVDIPPLAHVSAQYLKHLFGKENVAGYLETRDLSSLDINTLKEKYRAVVICPWQLEKVQGQLDVCINCTSFQEMEPEVVKNYAQYIEKILKHYLLLRNSRKGKPKARSEKELGVKTPITREDYFKIFSQYSLIRSDCQTFGYTFKNFKADLMLLERQYRCGSKGS